MTPRERREDVGGSTQKLVLAFFDSEDAAAEAAKALKGWEKASECMKVDAIGVLVKDRHGEVKTHKLGSERRRRPRPHAAIPTGGLSLVGGVLGGGVIGEFFHKGLKMTDEDAAHIGRELDGRP